MKIVVIGGTGLIGTQLCNNLRQRGHDVLAGSPSTGINALTGEGLDAALAGAEVVVDVANSPSFEDTAVLEFFETSGRNLFAAEKAAGVKHHVALSVVGTERMLDSGYFRAKMAQEKLIKDSGIPYSILRATQFFEFIGAIAQSGEQGNSTRLPAADLQPIASADVAAALAKIAEQPPTNQTQEVAGPDRLPIASFVQTYLQHNDDPREVISDAEATYFGAPIDDRSLTPGANPIIGAIHFDAWLKGN
ncbi:SDR family oxidoreductase [Pseudomonas nunensis]|uniref:SDR family oxidoreductase n=1 Tax=Pseudomonas nunensis TaxID=2961896 RepID=A0ABY5EMT7_9PSED|nr:SDR family oxidoreductase [Pseudomonas nunensis]KPN89839.1 NmrA family transcriptional regulator [Pseudomonas nunensis]MCL5224511.1 SDR family oxidoreductase [Pseudomonas nunensis]UTO16062.1 SDR family oxidoreductase [Pseudomonas nunensis]